MYDWRTFIQAIRRLPRLEACHMVGADGAINMIRVTWYTSRSRSRVVITLSYRIAMTRRYFSRWGSLTGGTFERRWIMRCSRGPEFWRSPREFLTNRST